MRLYVLARHAHSTLNAEGRINGDPSIEVPLTADGRAGGRAGGAPACGARARAVRAQPVPADARDGRCDARRPRRPSRRRAPARRHRRGRPRGRHDRRLPLVEGGALPRRTVPRRREPRRRGEAVRAGVQEAARRAPSRRSSSSATRSRCATRSTRRPAPDDLDGPEHRIPNATPYLFDDAGLTRAATRIEAARSLSAKRSPVQGGGSAKSTPN